MDVLTLCLRYIISRKIAARVAVTNLATEERWHPVRVIGVDFSEERRVIPFDRLLTDIRPEDYSLRLPDSELADPFRERPVPGILLGTSLARELGVRPG